MNSDRVLLGFSTMSMASREVMLLKSFMRVLDGRTTQRWFYKPGVTEGEQQGADLIFFGDDIVSAPVSADKTLAGRQLRMGVLSLNLSVLLGWPLRPDELEQALNRVGGALVKARTAPHMRGDISFFSPTVGSESLATRPSTHLWRPVAEGSAVSEFAPATAGVSGVALAVTLPECLDKIAPAGSGSGCDAQVSSPFPHAPLPEIALDDELRLLRWPQAKLINTPAKLKLAALMTGATSTLGKLQKTSGQSLSACSEFLEGMHQMGFVSVVPVVPRRFVEHADQEAACMLPDMTSGTATAPEKEPSAQIPVPSLFARIRARLGISRIH